MAAEGQLSSVLATDLIHAHRSGQEFYAAPQILATFSNTSQPVVGATIDNTSTSQAYRPTNAQTGTSYTLVLTDSGKIVTCSNASAIALTVPPNSSVAFAVGAEIVLFQLGAGLVTVTAGAGVTVHQVAGTLKALGQYARIVLTKIATDTWQANGDLAAS